VGNFGTYDIVVEFQHEKVNVELHHTASRLDLRLHYIFDLGCKH